MAQAEEVMRKLSTGQDSTLGNYLDLAKAVFGPRSKATFFLEGKIAQDGAQDEVIADESQMLMLLGKLHLDDKPCAHEDGVCAHEDPPAEEPVGSPRTNYELEAFVDALSNKEKLYVKSLLNTWADREQKSMDGPTEEEIAVYRNPARFNAGKIQVIKLVRERTNMNLVIAKNLVDRWESEGKFSAP